MDEDLRQRLDAGLAAMGLELSEAQRETLIAYVGLLSKWNRAYNLTAVRDPREMMVRHILDSLAVAPYVGGHPGAEHGGAASGGSVSYNASGTTGPHGDPLRIIDVGTGPGLPGIPLAVFCPECEFFLLDTNGKKTRFLIQAKAELGLGNVTVVHSRVEAYRPDVPFDVVIARAFASLSEIVSGCRHLLAPRGRILAMKGTLPEAELAAMPADVSAQAARLTVPGLEHEKRHVIAIRVLDSNE